MLAEYADNVLDDQTRTAVERHLVECADCREILAESKAFVRQDAAAAQAAASRVLPFRRRWPVVAGAVAAAAAIALVVRVEPSLLSRVGLGESGNPTLSELVDAVGSERHVEGRLTGGFEYGPLQSVARGANRPTQNVALLAVAASLQQRAREDPSAENLHAWGVAQLQLRNVREAVQTLEAARDADPRSAAVRVDLAVAYMDAATQLQAAQLLPRALELLEEVLAEEPESPEALFTRAIALEQLAMPQEAAVAWQAFLRVESDSAWADEAERRLERLQGNPSAAQGDKASDPASARAALEDIELPGWARTSLDNPGSARSLASLSGMQRRAALIADQQGDRLLSDALAALDRTLRTRETAAREASLRGVLCLADVRERQRKLETNGLAEEAAACRGVLTSLNRPLALWSAFYQSLGYYYDGRIANSRNSAEQILETAAEYPILSARIQHHLGGLAYTEARYEDAVSYLRPAVDELTKAREDLLAASASQAWAAALIGLGDAIAAWPVHLRALALSGRSAPAGRRFSLFASVGRAGLEQGLPRFARVMFEAAIASARASNGPGLEAEGLVFLARAQTTLRDPSVKQTIVRLRDLVPLVASDGVRARLTAEAALAEGEILLTENPSQAQQAAERALMEYRDVGSSFRSATLELLRGRAARRAGDVAAAREAIARGLDAIETESAHIEQRRSDILYRDRVWDLYGEAASLALSTGDPTEALESLERGRTRRTRRNQRTPLKLSHGDIRTVVVAFHEIDDRIHRWVAHGRSIRHDELSKSAGELESDVKRLRSEIEAGAEHAAASSLVSLSVTLLGDVLAGMPGSDIGDLVVVPSPALQRVPFPALRDGGFPLAQRFRVRIAPSFETALAIGHSNSELTARVDSRVTLIGAPTSPQLPFLASVPQEVREIRAMYADAEVYEGPAATPLVFRRALNDASIIHFSGHAVSNVDRPWSSFLAFPEGTLGMTELTAATAPVSADVVILSACATVDGTATRSQGLVSIASELVELGVGSVIGTLWDVQDRDAYRLFVDLHSHLSRGVEAAEAVRLVQSEAFARNEPLRAWASMTIVASR